MKSEAGEAGPEREARGAWTIAVVGALSIMAGLGFGRFSYTMLLPSTREGLGLTYTAAGFLATANLGGYLAGSVASGAVMRRLGPPATVTWALGVLALGLAWMAAADGIVDAALARAIAGGAGALAYVQALGLIGSLFSRRTRGLASGLMHSGNGLGFVVTGLALPAIVETGSNGWRRGWFALALLTLLIMPFVWCPLRRTRAQASVAREPEASGGAPRSSEATSVFEYGVLYALFGLAYVIYATFFAEILRARGLPLAQAGLVWAAVGALSLGSGILGGAFSDWVGRRRGLAVFFALQGVSYVMLINRRGAALVVSVVLFGVTAWGIPAIMAAAMSDLERLGEASTAFGRITAMMGVGQAVGPLLSGVVADLTGAAESGLWISTGAAAGAVAWLYVRPRYDGEGSGDVRHG